MLALLASTGEIFAQDDIAALAEAAQNPLASMISLPFQNNTNFDYGPEGGRPEYAEHSAGLAVQFERRLELRYQDQIAGNCPSSVSRKLRIDLQWLRLSMR